MKEGRIPSYVYWFLVGLSILGLVLSFTVWAFNEPKVYFYYFFYLTIIIEGLRQLGKIPLKVSLLAIAPLLVIALLLATGEPNGARTPITITLLYVASMFVYYLWNALKKGSGFEVET